MHAVAPTQLPARRHPNLEFGTEEQGKANCRRKRRRRRDHLPAAASAPARCRGGEGSSVGGAPSCHPRAERNRGWKTEKRPPPPAAAADPLPQPRKEVPWGGPFRQPARVCQKNRAGCGIPEGGGEDFASRSRDSTVSRSREVRTCPHVRDAIHTTALRGTPNT